MAEKIVKENRNKYPDDVAAFANFITATIEKELDEIENRLSGRVHINEVFPKTGEYSVSEIVDFYSAMATYYIFKNNIKKADICIALAEEIIDWDEPYQQYAWMHAKDEILLKKLAILKDLEEK